MTTNHTCDKCGIPLEPYDDNGVHVIPGCKCRNKNKQEENTMTENKEQTDGIVAEVMRVAALRYKTRILPVLYEVDMINASVANELMRLHATENVVERHNIAWDRLKVLIQQLEQREETKR